ncbi:MAG: PAS domain S-box protein [Methanotrichaceae archaeon]|nr:PAS domain S-box protein [Methanotrichaceae archaeon]
MAGRIHCRIEDLRPGEHAGVIFSRDEDQISVALAFLCQGLENGELIACQTNNRLFETLQEMLSEKDISKQALTQRKQLLILPGDRVYRVDEPFTPQGLISVLHEAYRAVGEGRFRAMRVLLEMTWASSLTVDEISSFFSAIDEFVCQNNCLILCQYDGRLISHAAMEAALRCHPILIYEGEAFDNYCYLSPEKILRWDFPVLRLRQFMSSLKKRRTLELEVNEREENLSLALHSAPLILFRHDKDLRYIWISNIPPEFAMRPEDVLGRTDMEIMDHAEARKLMEIKQRALESEKRVKEEIWLSWEGKQLFFELTAEPVKNDDGCITGLICSALNLTGRKRSEDALRMAEENYLSLLQSINEGIWSVDADGRTIFVNKRMAEMLGCREEEMLSRSIFSFLDGKDRELCRTYIDSSLQVGSGLHDFEFLRKDGSRMHALLEASPFLDPLGNLSGFVAAVLDITERKHMEDALRASEEKYRNLVEQASDGIVLCRTSGAILAVNDQLCKMTGYREDELLKMNCSDLIPEEELVRRPLHIDEVMSGKKVVLERVVRRRDGRAFPVEISAKALQNNTIQAMVRDISERKKAEDALIRYKDQLEDLVAERTDQLQKAERLAAIGETASMIGHDLRNPLQAITCTIYLAKERLRSGCLSGELDNATLKEMLDSVDESVRYMNKVVSDLQDYARPLRAEMAWIDVPKLIRGALSIIYVPEGIEVSVRVKSDFPKLLADGGMLKRIIINLVNNAVQSISGLGKVTVSALEKGDRVEIVVSDSGEGIAGDVMPKVFQPLFTTKAKGVGMGLSVCRRLAEAMGGEITIKSTAGVGTDVTIALPLGDQ